MAALTYQSAVAMLGEVKLPLTPRPLTQLAKDDYDFFYETTSDSLTVYRITNARHEWSRASCKLLQLLPKADLLYVYTQNALTVNVDSLPFVEYALEYIFKAPIIYDKTLGVWSLHGVALAAFMDKDNNLMLPRILSNKHSPEYSPFANASDISLEEWLS